MTYGRKRGLRPNKKVLARKRKAFLIWGGIAASLLIVLIGGVAYASGRPEITIQTITIKGNSTILTSDLEQLIQEKLDGRYGFLFSRHNSFIYPRGSIKASVLESYTRIREVDVSRTDLNTLVLSVVERKPYALWCDRSSFGEDKKQCYFIDDGGFIFTEAPMFTGSVFFIYYSAFKESPIGNQVLPPEEFKELSRFVDGLADLLLEPVSLSFEEQNDVIVYMADGSKLFFNRGHELLAVFENLKLVLDSDDFEDESMALDYIDLRFGNNVYFKVK